MQKKIEKVKKINWNIYILSAVRMAISHRLPVLTSFIDFYRQPQNYPPFSVFFRLYVLLILSSIITHTLICVNCNTGGGKKQ